MSNHAALVIITEIMFMDLKQILSCLFGYNHAYHVVESLQLLEIGVKQIKKYVLHCSGFTPLRSVSVPCSEHYRKCDNIH